MEDAIKFVYGDVETESKLNVTLLVPRVHPYQNHPLVCFTVPNLHPTLEGMLPSMRFALDSGRPHCDAIANCSDNNCF